MHWRSFNNFEIYAGVFLWPTSSLPTPLAPVLPLIHVTVTGIYRIKQESKKTRKHAFDQESDHKKKKPTLDQESDLEKKDTFALNVSP